MRNLPVILGLAVAACGSSRDDGTSGTTGTSSADESDGSTQASDADASGETGVDTTATGADSESSGPAQCDDPAAWLDLPTSEQVDALRSGELCCTDVTQAYLERVEASEQAINAVIALDDEAPASAAALDMLAARGGSLHCAVVLVKDNIDVAAMANTAGSLAMVDNVVRADAPVVARLREAGALVLGKANLSEWANFRGQNSTSGWSSFGGQTNNGADPSFNPCGSSSGSGAAVAAGIVSAAIGTETSGSIVCPSSMNGVVGMKPTLGLVSRTGIIPIAHSHDTAGPMTKTVRDAALLLSVMAGPDPADPATAEIPGDFDYDFGAALDATNLAGARLGFSSGFAAQFSGEEQDLFDARLGALADAGAEIVEIQMPSTAGLSGALTTVLTYELKADLNAYLLAHAQPGVPASLAELIAFNDANAAEVMPYFGQEWFIQAEATPGLDAPEYLSAAAQVKEQAGPQGLLAVLEGSMLDAIVLPTTGPAWTTDYQGGDAGSPSSAFLPAAAGYPHLTVPMGEVAGLPVGISFIGRPWDDGRILALGHAYEQLP